MKQTAAWFIGTVLAGMFFVSLGGALARAETRTAIGTIISVEEGGKAITFRTELGEVVTSKPGRRSTRVFRGDKEIEFRELKAGDVIWITYRPGKENEPSEIKTEPNIPREIESLKDRLARAIRILNMEGLVAFSGHISARIPGSQTFFIHPSSMSRAEVTPGDLCEVTIEGKQISGKDSVPDETDIHAAVYRARKDANCVLHIHPHYIIIPSLVGKDLIPVSGHGCIFGAVTPVYPNPSKISSRTKADEMAKILGKGRAVVLKGHGAVITEGTVEAVVTAAVYMEENAQLLQDARASGTPIPFTAEEIREAADETYQPSSITKTWEYYIEKGSKAGIFWDSAEK